MDAHQLNLQFPGLLVTDFALTLTPALAVHAR